MGLLGSIFQIFIPRRTPRLYYPVQKFASSQNRRQILNQQRRNLIQNQRAVSFRRPLERRPLPSQVSIPQTPKKSFFSSMLSTNFELQPRVNQVRKQGMVNRVISLQRRAATIGLFLGRR